MWNSESGTTRIRTPWTSRLPGAISNIDPAFTPGTAANHIGHGHVWKLGKRWKLDSIVRLWRQRFLAVKEGYAYFYRDERDWKEGKDPMKVANLEGANIEVNPTKQVLSEKQRDAWVAILQTASDPERFSSKSRGVAARLEVTPEIPLFEGESLEIEKSKRQLDNEFASKAVVNRSFDATQDSPAGVHESEEDDESAGRGVFGKADGVAPRITGKQQDFSDAIPFQTSPVISEVNKEELSFPQVNRSGVSIEDESWVQDPAKAAKAATPDESREDGTVEEYSSSETATLARFAQRWKEEAEKMTQLAKESMRAKEIAEEEVEAMRAALEESRNSLKLADDKEREDGDMDQLVGFLRMEIDARDEELAAANAELQAVREGVERQIEEAIEAGVSRHDMEVQTDLTLDMSIGSEGCDREQPNVNEKPGRGATEISVSPVQSPIQGTAAAKAKKDEEAVEEDDDEKEKSESSSGGVRTTVRQAILSASTVWMLSWACCGWFAKHTSLRYRAERRGFQAFREQISGRKRREMEVEVSALRTAMAGMREASSIAGSILQSEDQTEEAIVEAVVSRRASVEGGRDSPLPPPPVPVDMSLREHQIRLEMEDVIQGLRDDLNDERAGADKDRARHRAEMQKMSHLVQSTQRAKVETEKSLDLLRQEVARARDSYMEKEQRLLQDAERMIVDATKKATSGLILQTEQRLRASEVERQQLQLECQRLKQEAARAREEAKEHTASINSGLGGSSSQNESAETSGMIKNKSDVGHGSLSEDVEAGAKEDWHVWEEV